MMADLQSSQPNTQEYKKMENICYKPIKICPGSWQTSLVLGLMSRYTAHILIYKLNNHVNDNLHIQFGII